MPGSDQDTQRAWVVRVLGIEIVPRVATNGLADFTKRLEAMMPDVRAAVGNGHPQAQDIRLKVSEASVFARKQDFAQAHKTLDVADTLLKGSSRPGDGSEKPPPEKQPTLRAALDIWANARADVIKVLKQYETAIRAFKYPLNDGHDPNAFLKTKDQAIILVKAISANLTAVPDTANSVRELRRYLDTDEIIKVAEEENGFGIDVRIQQPLISALGAIESALGSLTAPLS